MVPVGQQFLPMGYPNQNYGMIGNNQVVLNDFDRPALIGQDPNARNDEPTEQNGTDFKQNVQFLSQNDIQDPRILQNNFQTNYNQNPETFAETGNSYVNLTTVDQFNKLQQEKISLQEKLSENSDTQEIDDNCNSSKVRLYLNNNRKTIQKMKQKTTQEKIQKLNIKMNLNRKIVKA